MAGTETTRQEIAQLSRQFGETFTGGDMAALAALYTEDGQVLPPGGPTARGRQAIRQFWQGARDAGIEAAELQTLEVVGGGDLACEIGRGTLTVRGDGGTSRAVVRYVVVWRRQGDGWKMAVDTWNSEA
jgi:uncharacterized protein (TIGR02246 family)